VPKVKVEILYFEGCPSHEAATKILREVLAEREAEYEVELVEVNSDEEARRRRFPGSPTIRVDGRDLFPVAEQSAWALGCRMYVTPEGLKGYPTTEMIREALAR
jgi:hypothetical protein